MDFQQVQKMVTNQTMISNELMWHRIGWFQDLIMHLEAWLDFPLSDEEGNFAGNVGRVGVLFKSNLRGQPAKSYKKIKTRMEVKILFFGFSFLTKIVDKQMLGQTLIIYCLSMCRIDLVTSTSHNRYTTCFHVTKDLLLKILLCTTYNCRCSLMV
ncbi:uncharacterized protein LOC110224381 isoform X1 [Arabidopsis lyrata subsp. lyrata]|uniref:uncharacterized protein LOC110224381 isoform X1 n=1 Tax=Arabidopsis lyrata subsp. lyrata TaxID=81972 RepID=UPI000A29A7B9|nr:uncharacterized protein LOC110224381 isoform X1 [Arabidopsis lyrata subsp. lyrata]|eukprot:XP_020866062.1 uncharacterized protein LOC110224381 isoform X1 [Arabidopsis lyrata subsp. lyrata]